MGNEPASDTLSDQDLVGRVAAGDARAFAALFHRRQREVYRFALHVSGAPAVADDVTQEVFLAVMRDAGRYEPGRASVAAWLCGIARNHVRRRLQADRSLVSLDDRDEEGDEPGDGFFRGRRVVGPGASRACRSAAQGRGRLPLRYREVIVLCDLQEMPYADAAAALECALGTVRSRLHRARALLAAKLGIAERVNGGGRRAAAARTRLSDGV